MVFFNLPRCLTECKALGFTLTYKDVLLRVVGNYQRFLDSFFHVKGIKLLWGILLSIVRP